MYVVLIAGSTDRSVGPFATKTSALEYAKRIPSSTYWEIRELEIPTESNAAVWTGDFIAQIHVRLQSNKRPVTPEDARHILGSYHDPSRPVGEVTLEKHRVGLVTTDPNCVLGD